MHDRYVKRHMSQKILSLFAYPQVGPNQWVWNFLVPVYFHNMFYSMESNRDQKVFGHHQFFKKNLLWYLTEQRNSCNLRASNDDIIFIFGWIIPLRHYFIINITKTIFLKYSGKKKYLIPCWFCTFAHWQRNDQSIILMLDLFQQWETE